MHELSTLGGLYTSAWGINNQGQIVGRSRQPNGNDQAVLWDNGQIKILPSLGGASHEATRINDLGEIVGTSNDKAGNPQAVVWRNGKISKLTIQGSKLGWGAGISNQGRIYGDCVNKNGQSRACFWENDRVIDFEPIIGTYGALRDSNAYGQLIGWGRLGGNHYPLLFERGVSYNLGTLGGAGASAHAINNKGEIVGSSQDAAGVFQAFYYAGKVAKNQLVNGDFEAGVVPWTFVKGGQADFTTASPGYFGNAAARINATNPSGTVQLVQTFVPLEAKTRYRLRFAAYSTAGRDLSLYLQRSGTTTSYGLSNFKVNLTAGWAVYTVDFTTKGFARAATDAQLSVRISPFAKAGDIYWLDQIALTKLEVGAADATDAEAVPIALSSDSVSGHVQLPVANSPVSLNLVDL